jgi:hypothetical protein
MDALGKTPGMQYDQESKEEIKQDRREANGRERPTITTT